MRIIKKDIYSRVLDFIIENELISKGEKILLSLSAGKDSIALLDIFLHIKNEFTIDIAIFHLNHKMRGKESDDDEAFLAEIAARNNLEIFIHSYDFLHNKPNRFSFEEFARKKRYELLNKICTDNNFQKIAIAHTSDDNIETILMRIINGTGIHGLEGISYKRGKIIRPILFLNSKEIYKHLEKNNITWREDSSNKDNKYIRNYLRNSILPEINNRFPRTGQSILSLSRTAREYNILINELLGEKLGHIYFIENGNVIIDNERISSDKKIFKYVLQKAVVEIFGEFVTTGILEEIYRNAISRKSNVILYKNKRLFVKKSTKNNKKIIVISRNIGLYNYIKDWEYRLNLQFDDEKTIYIKEIGRNIYFKYVNYNYYLINKKRKDIVFIALNDYIIDGYIRNRRKGDRIKQEFGLKKIKDLFIDWKLENSEKRIIPLFIIGSEVAAVMPDFLLEHSNRVSSNFYINEGSKKILAIYQ